MSVPRPRRSALFMPASNSRAIEKARSLPCDVVILDLEDAVAPEAKEEARAQAVAAAREGGFGRRELVIRVNGIDTPWGAADLAAVTEAGADAVLAPKVDDAETVRRYQAALAKAPADMGFWAMIETTRAVFRLDEIAVTARDTRLACFVLGTNDLAKEMRARQTIERPQFTGFMAQAVAAARGHGIVALDAVYNAFDDDDGFARQCIQARDFGFDGKSLIHPRQIDAANLYFGPSPDDVAWAEAVVAAFASPEAAGKGVIRVNGQMTERLHMGQAEQILAMAKLLS